MKNLVKITKFNSIIIIYMGKLTVKIKLVLYWWKIRWYTSFITFKKKQITKTKEQNRELKLKVKFLFCYWVLYKRNHTKNKKFSIIKTGKHSFYFYTLIFLEINIHCLCVLIYYLYIISDQNIINIYILHVFT